MGPKEISACIILDVTNLEETDPIPDLLKIQENILNDNTLSMVDTNSLDTILSDDSNTSNDSFKKETHRKIASQVIIPFIIAGFAMVGAGLYLDMITTWPVFINIPELMILVPALLGLKGNLEQTLASRLSTDANTGKMETKEAKVKLITGNIALVQVQAIAVGFLASLLAIAMDFKNFNTSHALLLCSSSVFTAALASFVLGIITSLVIVTAKYFKINPDNIATPIAASLGDITALVFLALSASFIYEHIDRIYLISSTIILFFMISLPLWIYFGTRSEGPKEVLKHGWIPVIMAMIISTCAGFVLNKVVVKYDDVALFQPLVNGIAGNLVAIQASKMSTQLHREQLMGILPSHLKVCTSPVLVFFSKYDLAVTARVLMAFVIPGHLLFVYIIALIKAHHANLSFPFLSIYLISVFIQVAIVIYLAVVLTNFFWLRNRNPDNMTIPYLTALGDFLGVCFLGITFVLLDLMGKSNVV